MKAIEAVEKYRACRDRILEHMSYIKTDGNPGADYLMMLLKNHIIIEFDETAVSILREESEGRQ